MDGLEGLEGSRRQYWKLSEVRGTEGKKFLVCYRVRIAE